MARQDAAKLDDNVVASEAEGNRADAAVLEQRLSRETGRSQRP
jgi:hypothetical protein